LLHAARLAHGTNVPLLGINRGRLGFLADISAAEMLERFEEVLGGRYSRDVRQVLEARIAQPAAPDKHARALNDVVLQKWQTGRMLDFETWIDGRYVNTHGGDGLVVATATGSTGYAMSCGGPSSTRARRSRCGSSRRRPSRCRSPPTASCSANSSRRAGC
jgi:NAD+ kinase